MAVEIREVVIKTEVRTREYDSDQTLSPEELEKLKRKVVQECLALLKKKTRTGFHNR